MFRYRVCKAFTVESGHMLSKHPERCRVPHGHTRRIEVIVSAEKLDSNDMVLDFKALKLAMEPMIDRFDHSMSINSNDPLLPEMRRLHPEGVIEFENTDPTTEVLAQAIFHFARQILLEGFEGHSPAGASYRIAAGSVRLERIRVWETLDSWAEYGVE